MHQSYLNLSVRTQLLREACLAYFALFSLAVVHYSFNGLKMAKSFRILHQTITKLKRRNSDQYLILNQLVETMLEIIHALSQTPTELIATLLTCSSKVITSKKKSYID